MSGLHSQKQKAGVSSSVLSIWQIGSQSREKHSSSYERILAPQFGLKYPLSTGRWEDTIKVSSCVKELESPLQLVQFSHLSITLCWFSWWYLFLGLSPILDSFISNLVKYKEKCCVLLYTSVSWGWAINRTLNLIALPRAQMLPGRRRPILWLWMLCTFV